MSATSKNGSNGGSISVARCGDGSYGPAWMAAEEVRLMAFPELLQYREALDQIRCGNSQGLEKLIDGGLSPNTKIGNGTLAYWAAYSGHIKIIEMLIRKGASINGEEGSFSPSPLLGAVDLLFETGDWNVYDYLLSAGADPEVRCGNPTLTMAGHLAMIRQYARINELLDRGYDRDLCELRYWVAAVDHPEDLDNPREWKDLLARLDSIISSRGEACREMETIKQGSR